MRYKASGWFKTGMSAARSLVPAVMSMNPERPLELMKRTSAGTPVDINGSQFMRRGLCALGKEPGLVGEWLENLFGIRKSVGRASSLAVVPVDETDRISFDEQSAHRHVDRTDLRTEDPSAHRIAGTVLVATEQIGECDGRCVTIHLETGDPGTQLGGGETCSPGRAGSDTASGHRDHHPVSSSSTRRIRRIR